ncbi:MAG: phage protein D [Crocinitomicaceae bacterium]|jgi:phage protein D
MSNAITVTLSGSATTDVSDQLVSMIVEKKLNKIPSATLELASGDFAAREYPLFDDADFKIGAELDILIRYENSGDKDKSIFKGIVVAVKFTTKDGVPIIVLGLKDPAFRLVNSVNTELFNAKNDKQMIEAILANQTGLSLAASDASMEGVVYDQYLKNQCSDWDFVLSRASEFGTVLSLDNGAMSAILPSETAGALTLDIGVDAIVDLNLEENAESLNADIEIGYWDIKTNAMLTVTETNADPNVAAVGSPSSAYVYLGFTDKKTAEAKLKSFATLQTLESIKGSIEIPGNPDAALMQELTLSNAPAQFNGTHTVSEVTHKLRFGNWITIVGIGNLSIPNLRTISYSEFNAQAITHSEIATAMAWEADPDGFGRIPVKIVAFGDKKYWAFPAQVAAGATQSSFILPEAAEQLIVGFLHGNYNQGIVLTSTYLGDAEPPAPFELSAETPVGFVSSEGLQMIFDNAEKDVLICSSDSNKIDINDADGIAIESKKDLKCESSAKSEFKAGSTVTVKGSKIDLN